MDPLYVVEFDVFGADAGSPCPSVDVYERMVKHAAAWLSRGASDQNRDDMLQSDGTADVQISTGERVVSRQVRWTVVGTSETQALTGSVTQELEAGFGAKFICEFTIFRDGDSAALRIEMGRETSGGVLTPAPVTYLRRPGLLRNVVEDPALRCSSQGQSVDGRFQWLNGAQAIVIPEVIEVRTRLPLLLVDGRGDSAREFAGAASRELAGLVQVVALDGRALEAIRENLEAVRAEIPHYGARLVWPDLSARHPDFTGAQVAFKKRAVHTILRMVSPLSVAARGQNQLLRRASRAARVAREEAFHRSLADARASGDTRSEVAALRERLEELTSENQQWLDEIERLEAELQELRAAKGEAQYWRETALAAQAARSAPSGARWDDAPECDAEDLHPLAEFLKTVSEGAVVFTPAAERSWKRCGYPHEDAMGQALVTLGQAAVEWRERECTTGGMLLDDWFKTHWGMNLSATDHELVKQRKDKFDFEGKSYSRVPHLKLDDHTSPNQVGRVYFALDTEGKRFIVDHVGLKLYGL